MPMNTRTQTQKIKPKNTNSKLNGLLIFKFNFLGLGICFGFLILGFGSSQRFFQLSLKIVGIGFFFVLVGLEHGL